MEIKTKFKLGEEVFIAEIQCDYNEITRVSRIKKMIITGVFVDNKDKKTVHYQVADEVSAYTIDSASVFYDFQNAKEYLISTLEEQHKECIEGLKAQEEPK